jgi:hypothetical protein
MYFGGIMPCSVNVVAIVHKVRLAGQATDRQAKITVKLTREPAGIFE